MSRKALKLTRHGQKRVGTKNFPWWGMVLIGIGATVGMGLLMYLIGP